MQIENLAVNARRPRDLPLFPQIDGGKRRSKLVRRARFDLDETNDIFIERNNVDFARNLHTADVSPDRNFEICQNYPVTVSFQKFDSKIFSVFADKTRRIVSKFF